MAEVQITVRAVDETGGVLDKLSASVGQLQERAHAVSQANSQVEDSSRGASGEMENMAAGAGAAAAASGKLGGALGPLARYLGASGVAYGLKSVVSSAADFAGAMGYVGTLVHGNQALMQEWRDQIISMAPELGRTPTDLAKGLYEVLSANIPVNDAMQMLARSAKAASAGQTDVYTSTKLLASTMHAYGENLNDVSSISDKFFTAVRIGMTTFPELAQSIGPVLPYAAQLHVSLDQVLAALTALTGAGYDTAEASTGLREAFAELYRNANKFRQAGIDIVADAQSGGIIKVLQDLQQITGGNAEEMQKFIPNIRALGPVLTLTGAQFNQFQQNLKDMKASAGETDSAFHTMMSNMQGSEKETSAAFAAFKDNIGASLNPAPILQMLTKIMEGFNWLTRETDKAGKAFGDLIASAVTSGEHLIDAFVQGVENEAEKAYNAVSSVVGKVRKLLPFSPAKEGPLSDLNKTGPAFIQTIADGITGSQGTLRSAVQDTLGAAIGSGSSSGILDSYAQAMGNLASVSCNQYLGVGSAYGFDFADSLKAQYQAQADAYQEAMGINTLGNSGYGSAVDRSAAGYAPAGNGSGVDLGTYAQVMGNLASVSGNQYLSVGSEYGFGFADSLKAQYQAQADAYQEATGINMITAGSGRGSSGAGSGGVTVNVSGITIQGTGNLSDVGSLADQLQTAIAESINRNSSPITAALKSSGL